MTSQRECYWPSGREVWRMHSARAREVLMSFGVDKAEIDALRVSERRHLIQRLKRQSHERGDCECPAAAHIRGVAATIDRETTGARRMAGELTACKTCGAPISSDRLEAQPRSVTCSTKCSQERKAILRKAGAARHRGRQKKNQEEGN